MYPSTTGCGLAGTSDASRLQKRKRMTSEAMSRNVDLTVSDIESWTALGAAAALVVLGLSRRSVHGLWMAAAATPLVYRGVTGRWPEFLSRHLPADDSRAVLSGDGGMHVLESVQVERPISEVYRFWRRLENLPRFMAHLDSVTDEGGGRSHWIARGPAGVRREGGA